MPLGRQLEALACRVGSWGRRHRQQREFWGYRDVLGERKKKGLEGLNPYVWSLEDSSRDCWDVAGPVSAAPTHQLPSHQAPSHQLQCGWTLKFSKGSMCARVYVRMCVYLSVICLGSYMQNSSQGPGLRSAFKMRSLGLER